MPASDAAVRCLSSLVRGYRGPHTPRGAADVRSHRRWRRDETRCARCCEARGRYPRGDAPPRGGVVRHDFGVVREERARWHEGARQSLEGGARAERPAGAERPPRARLGARPKRRRVSRRVSRRPGRDARVRRPSVVHLRNRRETAKTSGARVSRRQRGDGVLAAPLGASPRPPGWPREPPARGGGACRAPRRAVREDAGDAARRAPALRPDRTGDHRQGARRHPRLRRARPRARAARVAPRHARKARHRARCFIRAVHENARARMRHEAHRAFSRRRARARARRPSNRRRRRMARRIRRRLARRRLRGGPVVAEDAFGHARSVRVPRVEPALRGLLAQREPPETRARALGARARVHGGRGLARDSGENRLRRASQNIFVSEEALRLGRRRRRRGSHDDTGHDTAALPLSRRGLAMAMDAFCVSAPLRAALEALDAETGGAARRELQAAADAVAAATFARKISAKKPHEILAWRSDPRVDEIRRRLLIGWGPTPARASPRGARRRSVRRSPGAATRWACARTRASPSPRPRGFRRETKTRRRAPPRRADVAEARRGDEGDPRTKRRFSFATISTICGRTRTRFEVSRAMTVVLTVSTKARRRGASPRSAPAFSTSRASASPAGDWTSPRFRPRPRNRNGATVA